MMSEQSPSSPGRGVDRRSALIGALITTNLVAVLALVLALTGVIGPGSAPGNLDFLRANAGNTMSANGFIVATGLSSTDNEVLWVLDTNAKNLAVYDLGLGGKKAIHFISGRRVAYDLQVDLYNGTKPSPNDVRKGLTKSGK